MKSTRWFLLATIVILFPTAANSVYAQSTPLVYNVKLTSYTLQISYPSEAVPGEAVTVNVQGSPKNSGIYLQTLSVTAYYADANGLHTVSTFTLVNNPANSYQSYGTGSFSRSFTVTIPTNATRTSLIALFTETVQVNFYPAYYGYYGPYSYGLFWGFQFASYPSYYYQTTADSAISPLSYIRAATPEYTALLSKYQNTQQQLNQTQTENQLLQAKILGQNSTINELNQELTSSNGKGQAYQDLALILGLVAMAFATLNVATILRHRKTVHKEGTGNNLA